MIVGRLTFEAGDNIVIEISDNNLRHDSPPDTISN